MSVFAVLRVAVGVVDDVGMWHSSFLGVTSLERSDFEILEESAPNFLPVVPK